MTGLYDWDRAEDCVIKLVQTPDSQEVPIAPIVREIWNISSLLWWTAENVQ